MNGTHTEMHIDWCATPDYRYIIAIDNSVAANYGEWSELDGINDDLCTLN